MKRTTPILLSACMLAGACASGGDDALEFGVRRIALDLAFVDEDAAPPLEPEVIVRLVPAPAAVFQPQFDFAALQGDEPELALPDLPVMEICPTAPPSATVELPASPSVLDPPTSGKYLRSNTGTIEIIGASLPLTLPFPFVSSWTVSPEATVTRPGPLDVPGTEVTARQFTITKDLAPGFQIVETYEIGAAALLLVERITIANGTETRFRTDPPLEFFHFGAEGDDWVSAGADTENGFGVVIQGVIADRQVIDVCGDLVDTFVIEYTEQVVNLETAETQGTDSAEPSTLYIAPQYGGLVIREDLHTTQRTSVEGSPAVVNFDYVSTLAQIEPSP